MSVAYAHSLYAPTPEGFFVLKWAWDPTLLFFLLMCILYIRGLRAFRGKTPVTLWQKVLFFLGIAVLTMALLPPIDPLSDQLFFVHMAQHLMITAIGVPLMIFGVPFYVSIRGVSPWVRRNLYFPFIRNRLIRLIHKIWQKPLVAVAIFQANYWFWHIPKYYNLALLNDAIHLVEHACMAASSIYLWRIIIDPFPLRSPLKLPMRILYLGVMMALNIALSAALTFSSRVWYAYEGLPLPGWWRWDHLQDQRLGGLLMWVPGGFLTFLSMTILFFVWTNKERQKEMQDIARTKQLVAAGPVPVRS